MVESRQQEFEDNGLHVFNGIQDMECGTLRVGRIAADPRHDPSHDG